jgi:sugar/nucleoside kinase (ribokinase family)
MCEIWTMGEILVEIMRPKAGMQLFEKGEFLGPLPSGAPAIFIDTAAKLGHTAAIIGGVGRDDFGKCVLDRLTKDGVNCENVIQITGEKDVEDAVEKLFENDSMEVIALKKGKKGCTVYSREERFDFGVYNVVPVDPTGAGDSFDAGFPCGLAEGRPLIERTKIATAAASLNTAALGRSVI